MKTSVFNVFRIFRYTHFSLPAEKPQQKGIIWSCCYLGSLLAFTTIGFMKAYDGVNGQNEEWSFFYVVSCIYARITMVQFFVSQMYHRFSAFPKLNRVLIDMNEFHSQMPINVNKFQIVTNCFVAVVITMIVSLGVCDLSSISPTSFVVPGQSIVMIWYIGFLFYYNFLWRCLGLGFYSIAFVMEAFQISMLGNFEIIGGNVRKIFFLWFKTHERSTNIVGKFLIAIIFLMFADVIMCLYVFLTSLTKFSAEYLRWIGTISVLMLIILVESGEYLSFCVSILDFLLYLSCFVVLTLN